MSTAFVPTFRVWKSVKNVLGFIKNNTDTLFQTIKFYAPFLVTVIIARALLVYILPTFAGPVYLLAELFIGWVTYNFLLSWHRIVQRGPHADLAHPLKPDKRSLKFVGTSLLLIFLPTLCALPFGFLTAATEPPLNIVFGVMLVAAVLASCYIFTRCIIVLPSIAADEPLTLKQAFHLAKGYFWKILLSCFLLSLVILLGMIVVGIIMGILGFIAGLFGAGQVSLFTVLLNIIAELIMNVGIAPVISALGATLITNYYLHAKESNIPG